ncbi:hypothetical protein KKC59_03405, partial [bacterium]|nr:hypothetical protein [bacterium]
MIKRIVPCLLVLISFFLIAAAPSDDLDKLIELKIQTKPADNGLYLVSVFVKGVAKYPYPTKQDVVNRLLGRRAAIIYAYKRLSNLIERDLKDLVKKEKIKMTDDGYIYLARVVRTRFAEDHAGVIVELPIMADEELLNSLKKLFEEKYKIEEIDNIAKDYDDQLSIITPDFFEK